MDFISGTKLMLGCKTQLFRGVELLWEEVPFGDCSEPVNIAIYPYRSAIVTGKDRISLPRKALSEFEHRVCKACGTDPDNHSAFGIETGSLADDGSSVLYFWFTDGTVFVGRVLQFDEDKGLQYPVKVANKPYVIKPPVQKFDSLPTGV